MRKKSAFTLIELILSMVIIAIAFTVLPKILQLAAKVSVQNVREEAMYNAVAYIGLIKSTAWDEKNTEVDDILHVSNYGNSDYNCSTATTYRIGGFDGSRNCKNNQGASSLGSDSGESYNDDMDDFGTINATNNTNSRDYNLTVNVNYIQDIALNSDTFSSNTMSPTTNTKEINVTVTVKKKASALGNSLVKMSFTAQNIGQLQINRRAWN
jgi:prepilin-type N-terminal cleavage/methylation domain-containing protein